MHFILGFLAIMAVIGIVNSLAKSAKHAENIERELVSARESAEVEARRQELSRWYENFRERYGVKFEDYVEAHGGSTPQGVVPPYTPKIFVPRSFLEENKSASLPVPVDSLKSGERARDNEYIIERPDVGGPKILFPRYFFHTMESRQSN